MIRDLLGPVPPELLGPLGIVLLSSILIQLGLAKRAVRTRNLHIVDRTGRVRMALGGVEEHGVLLRVFDGRGNPRIVLGTEALDAPFITVLDDHGRRSVITMGHGPEGSTYLTLGVKEDGPLAHMVSRGGIAEVGLWSSKSGFFAGAQAWKDGVRLAINDAAGQDRFVATVAHGDRPVVRLIDDKSTVLFEAPIGS